MASAKVAFDTVRSISGILSPPVRLVGCKKKHVKKFSIKNFWAPKTPPPRNSLRPFSCILKGKEVPNIKNLRGRGSLWGGGVSAQILYVYALFLVLELGTPLFSEVVPERATQSRCHGIPPAILWGYSWGMGGILFREYCFGEENSLSSAANSVSSARNSVSSRLHTNNRPKGTHWVRSPELSEPKKTHWVRCLKPYSPKPYSARFRILTV